MRILNKIFKRNNKSPKDYNGINLLDLKDMLSFLNPMGKHKTTAILLLLNIIVFLIMIFDGLNIVSPTPKELLEIGGNRRFEIMNGEYWRSFNFNKQRTTEKKCTLTTSIIHCS